MTTPLTFVDRFAQLLYGSVINMGDTGMTNWPKHQDSKDKLRAGEEQSAVWRTMPAELFKAPVKVEPVKVSDPWEAE